MIESGVRGMDFANQGAVSDGHSMCQSSYLTARLSAADTHFCP